MPQIKLDRANPEDLLAGVKIQKDDLKAIVDKMKTLLQPFRYGMKVSFEEDNGILNTIRLDVTIKNLR